MGLAQNDTLFCIRISFVICLKGEDCAKRSEATERRLLREKNRQSILFNAIILGQKVLFQLTGADIQEPSKGRIFCIVYWQDAKKTYCHVFKIKIGTRGNIYTNTFATNLSVDGCWFQPLITKQSTIVFLSHPSYSIDCWVLKLKLNPLLRWKYTVEKAPVVRSGEEKGMMTEARGPDNYFSLVFSRPRLQDNYAIFYVYDVDKRFGQIWALDVSQNVVKTLPIDFDGHDVHGRDVQVQKLASDTLFVHGFCATPSCNETTHLHRIYLLPI